MNDSWTLPCCCKTLFLHIGTMISWTSLPISDSRYFCTFVAMNDFMDCTDFRLSFFLSFFLRGFLLHCALCTLKIRFCFELVLNRPQLEVSFWRIIQSHCFLLFRLF
jgi:hypothetical protein